MEEAAAHLLGTHDFLAFSSLKRSKKSTVRTLREIRLEEVGQELQLTFTGDGFLYHMVRILVGNAAGRRGGNHGAVGNRRNLSNRPPRHGRRHRTGKGLCLMEVQYP